MPILELQANQTALARVLRAIWSLFRRGRTSNNPPDLGMEAKAHYDTENQPRHASPIRRRLEEAVSRLERIDTVRLLKSDPRFGKSEENQIIWGELIEMELQEIDEQVSRISSMDGRKP